MWAYKDLIKTSTMDFVISIIHHTYVNTVKVLNNSKKYKIPVELFEV